LAAVGFSAPANSNTRNKQSQGSGPSNDNVYEGIGGSQNGLNRPTGMPFIGTLGRLDNVTQQPGFFVRSTSGKGKEHQKRFYLIYFFLKK